MALFSKKPETKAKDTKKKTKKVESDGQEKYFKEEYNTLDKKPQAKKSAPKKSAVSKATESNATKGAVVKKKTTPAPAKKAVTKPSEKTATKKTTGAKPGEKAATKKAATAKTTEKADTKQIQKKSNYKEYSEDSAIVKGSVAINESRATANGKFDIRRAKDGRFFFSLYASNHTVIAYSQIYSSTASVNTGINSVITNSPKAGIEDTTLKSAKSLPFPKWEIYIDKASQYRFRLYASNGQCICHSSHGYATKGGCKGGIESIKRFSAEARVDKSYLK